MHPHRDTLASASVLPPVRPTALTEARCPCWHCRQAAAAGDAAQPAQLMVPQSCRPRMPPPPLLLLLLACPCATVLPAQVPQLNPDAQAAPQPPAALLLPAPCWPAAACWLAAQSRQLTPSSRAFAAARKPSKHTLTHPSLACPGAAHLQVGVGVAEGDHGDVHVRGLLDRLQHRGCIEQQRLMGGSEAQSSQARRTMAATRQPS